MVTVGGENLIGEGDLVFRSILDPRFLDIDDSGSEAGS
jgi:hypothetical protein